MEEGFESQSDAFPPAFYMLHVTIFYRRECRCLIFLVFSEFLINNLLF